MIVFAAMKCECVYESGFEVLDFTRARSQHTRHARDWWVARWNEWNHDQSGDNIPMVIRQKRRLRHDTATHQNAGELQQRCLCCQITPH